MEKRPIKFFVKKDSEHQKKIELAKQLEEQMPGTPGLTDLIVKGWGNGYAIIPPGHPLYGVDMMDINIAEYDRAITFAHYAENICWPEISQEEKDCYVIGFDTMHCYDTARNCPEEYVRAKAQELAEILDSMW